MKLRNEARFEYRLHRRNTSSTATAPAERPSDTLQDVGLTSALIESGHNA